METQSFSFQYLFAVALSFLPRANRVKCRYEVHRAVGKVLAAGNRRLMDSQRIWVLKNGVTVKKTKETLMTCYGILMKLLG